VASLLEVARALSTRPPLRNDVVVVLTDAEEACLCGAEAFAGRHPLATDGGVVLNHESRGTGGPPVMFETSTNNAGVVGVFARSAPHPVGTSVAVEVYRLLPNDTDFSPFLDRVGFTGLNTAYIDGSAAYHTPEDTPDRMELGSLQAHGDNALALARAFGAADLTDLAKPSANDATYFPVLGWLLRYPGWLVWPIAGLAVVAVLTLAWACRRRGDASWPLLAMAFGAGLVPLVLAPVAAQLLWLALVAVRPGYSGMIDPWRPGWFRLAVVALVATVLLGWYALLRRRIGAPALIAGVLGWLALIGVVLAAAAPGGSYLTALPALAGAAAALVNLRLDRFEARVAASTAGAAVAVVILVPTVFLFLPALGLATGAAAALLTLLLGFAVLPVLDLLFADPLPPKSARSRLTAATPALACAAMALAFVGIGLGVDRFDARHPAPAQLMYTLDADTGQARWASVETSPTDWTSQYVDRREDLSDEFPIFGDEAVDLATGPAIAASLQAPQVETVSDTVVGNERRLSVRVRPQRDVRLVSLTVESGPHVVRATVDGREAPAVTIGDAAPFSVLFHGPPPEGVEIELVLAAGDASTNEALTDPVSLRVIDGSDGLSGLPGFSPRPADFGIAGSHTSELVAVAATYTLPAPTP
jgi:hypothetical protein